MATKSLGNPFDADTSLTHTNDCSCRLCQAESVNPGGLTDDQRLVLLEQQAEQGEGHRQSSEAGGCPSTVLKICSTGQWKVRLCAVFLDTTIPVVEILSG